MEDSHSVPLNKKRCVACESGTPPLPSEEATRLLIEVPGWALVEGNRIEREFRCRDFAEALKFVNEIGVVAEEENHHPDILLHQWRFVKLVLMTHASHG